MAYIFAAIGVMAVASYYLVTSIASWYRLRHFPGPFLATFSWIWLAIVTQSGRMDTIFLNTKRKYNSPLIRIAPGFLLTDSADIIRHINGVRSGYLRDDWYRGFTVNPYIPSMLSTTDEDLHNTLKAKTGHGYYGRDVSGIESRVDSQIASLKNLFRRNYLSTATELKPMELARKIQFFTLDVITKVGFGQEWGFLNADTDLHSFVGNVMGVAPLVQLCMDIPLARNIFLSPIMLRLAGPKETDKKGFGHLMKLSNKAVVERFKELDSDKGNSGNDILGSFIRHGLTEEQCHAEIPALVIAGSDTSAGVLRTALLHLMTSPLAYQRLQAEIDEAVKSGAASSPVTFAETRNMPYLQAAIHETIRMLPPSQILTPKVVPPGGDVLLEQYKVPAGTRIALNLIGIQRDTSMFGQDVDLFRPERFLCADPEKKLKMELQAELVWGHGRYICSGKMVAQMELHKSLFEMLRDFDFQLLDPQVPWKKRLHIIYIVKDMWVRVTAREDLSEAARALGCRSD